MDMVSGKVFAGSKVLIVEDDSAIRFLCEKVLSQGGCSVVAVECLAMARAQLAVASFDLLVVDLNLPDGDGLQLVEEVHRTTELPVLIMTQRDSPDQRLAGFDAGATDYLIKPFLPGELIHRVNGMLKVQLSDDVAAQSVLLGTTQLNMKQRCLQRQDGGFIELTTGEFDLLLALVEANGRALSRGTLLEVVTRRDSFGHPRTVDVLVSRLRKKLEPEPTRPQFIITVPRFGYRLDGAQ